MQNSNVTHDHHKRDRTTKRRIEALDVADKPGVIQLIVFETRLACANCADEDSLNFVPVKLFRSVSHKLHKLLMSNLHQYFPLYS